MQPPSPLLLSRQGRHAWILLLLAALIAAAVRWIDTVVPDISFGVLYVLSILPAALVLNRTQIVLVAVGLSVLRGISLEWNSSFDSTLRFLLALLAYLATGLLVSELMRNQRLVVDHSRDMQREQARREEVEQYLAALAESSPAALFTLDETGRVLLGNRAAVEMAGASSVEQLEGTPIASLLPALADALKFTPAQGEFRTSMQCSGRRVDGGQFLAQIWFSTYQTSGGRRLAAIAVDISEEIREREEQNLRQLLTNNRILASAMSHEIRNLSGAALPVYERLSQAPEFAAHPDFRLLGQMVDALARISAHDLQKQKQPGGLRTDLGEVLSHFAVIAEPNWRDVGGSIEWRLAGGLPFVQGEAYGILQVLMNMEQNARRAAEGRREPRLKVSAWANGVFVCVEMADNGPGVAEPKRLFEPFASNSGGSGLGLYVSRAICRGYGGDLRYTGNGDGAGARFLIELPILAGKETAKT